MLYCDYDYDWWRLFQKRVVCTKLDIYVLFTNIRMYKISSLSTSVGLFFEKQNGNK
jgi:hypothetical protein